MLVQSLQRRLDGGRWRPFAISVVVTLYVAGLVTGTLDALLFHLDTFLEGVP